MAKKVNQGVGTNRKAPQQKTVNPPVKQTPAKGDNDKLGMRQFRCCLCACDMFGVGNDAYPLDAGSGGGKLCCNKCFREKVTPARLKAIEGTAPAPTTPPAPVNTHAQPANGTAPAKKPDGLVRWLYRHHGGFYGVLRIVNGEEAEYFVECIGRSNVYTLKKLQNDGGPVYHLFLGANKEGKDSTCGCPGRQKGHLCKHIRAFLKLREENKL
jgi:hypothetical protein